jgi:eukaryotic-like serine/threonine-protein kinase
MNQTLEQLQYLPKQTLASSAMSTTMLADDPRHPGRRVVVKSLRSDRADEKHVAQFRAELLALARLDHPGIPRLLDTVQQGESGTPSLVMDYVDGAPLLEVLPEWSTQPDCVHHVCRVGIAVARILYCVHAQGLVHFDVHPGNIRVGEDGRVTLLDFGLVGEPARAGLRVARGTPGFIAPEVLRGAPVDHRADLYSLGMTLAHLLGLPEDNLAETIPPPEPLNRPLPAGLVEIVSRLVSDRPIDRPLHAGAVAADLMAVTGESGPILKNDDMQ